MIIRDANPPPLPIRVTVAHTCDACGKPLADRDEVMHEACKAAWRAREAARLDRAARLRAAIVVRPRGAR